MMAISAKKGSTNLAIAAWEWPSYFSPEKLLEGIKLNVSKWLRPSPECAPTDSKAAGLYMICSLSKHEAEKLGFDDALMLDYRGYIAEATGANIFFVKNSELFTPIADCFLNGITRQTVIEIAKENKITIHQNHFKLDFLKSCNEVFLTGTAVEITPVRCIESLNFEDRKVTKFLMSEFKKKVNT
jgi:branched-chain amino acid aminotransferase